MGKSFEIIREWRITASDNADYQKQVNKLRDELAEVKKENEHLKKEADHWMKEKDKAEKMLLQVRESIGKYFRKEL